MFDSGRLTLTPETATRDPIPVIDDSREGYWLGMGYPQGVCLPKFAQSAKGLGIREIRTLCSWSRTAIACHEMILPCHYLLISYSH